MFTLIKTNEETTFFKVGDIVRIDRLKSSHNHWRDPGIIGCAGIITRIRPSIQETEYQYIVRLTFIGTEVVYADEISKIS